MADLLNIGLSGLRVSQTQLTVTGHNIANVNTPGFTRQSATQSTTLPQFSGAGYIGSGATLTDIRRSYSEFLIAQLRNFRFQVFQGRDIGLQAGDVRFHFDPALGHGLACQAGRLRAAIGDLATLRIKTQVAVVDAVESKAAARRCSCWHRFLRLGRRLGWRRLRLHLRLGLRQILHRRLGRLLAFDIDHGLRRRSCRRADENPRKGEHRGTHVSFLQGSSPGICKPSTASVHQKTGHNWCRSMVPHTARPRFPGRQNRLFIPFIKHLCRGPASLTHINAISMVRAAFRAAGRAKPEIHASREHG